MRDIGRERKMDWDKHRYNKRCLLCYVTFSIIGKGRSVDKKQKHVWTDKVGNSGENLVILIEMSF